MAAAVGFARDYRLLLSIKGGGHNIAGTSIAEGGLTLDMSRMREVAVDPVAKLAHVGPGCLLSDAAVLRRELGADRFSTAIARGALDDDGAVRFARAQIDRVLIAPA